MATKTQPKKATTKRATAKPAPAPVEVSSDTVDYDFDIPPTCVITGETEDEAGILIRFGNGAYISENAVEAAMQLLSQRRAELRNG